MKPLLAALILLPVAAWADDPLVAAVVARDTGAGYSFDVTLRHPDSGWDHYADGWEVLVREGNRLGYRKLFHPHVNEQPFTRSLSGVMIPAGTATVYVRAHCLVDGWGAQRFEVVIAG
jgi:hypothetical protein